MVAETSTEGDLEGQEEAIGVKAFDFQKDRDATEAASTRFLSKGPANL